MEEAEDIPLFFKLIPVLALLSNYDRENCLINVGTEGAKMPIRLLTRWELADVGDVAFFEGFVKHLHIAVTSTPAWGKQRKDWCGDTWRR